MRFVEIPIDSVTSLSEESEHQFWNNPCSKIVERTAYLWAVSKEDFYNFLWGGGGTDTESIFLSWGWTSSTTNWNSL